MRNQFKKGHTINNGRKHSEETKKKWSELRKKAGQKPPSWKGKHHTKETKEKMSRHQKKLVAEGTHRFWKGGLTKKNRSERVIIMNTIEYREWRESVFKRDNYTCQNKKCGIKNGLGKTIYLEAHHIKSFREFPELRFELSNGLTLCKDCHKREGRPKKEKL